MAECRVMRALPLTGVPGKMTRRLAAVTLAGLGMTVFFGALVARQFAVAAGDLDGRATTYLLGGTVLGLVCVLTAGLLRRPWGVTLGWVLLVLTAASAVVLPAMAIVALIFGGLWVLSLTQGYKMDRLTLQWEAENADRDAGENGA